MTTLKDLERVALDGRINRRDFIQQATALGVTAAAAATFADSAALAETPQRGGTFRIAVDDGNTTDSLDPATYESTFQIFLPRMITNNLTEITPDNELGPDAAESWEATPDAGSWTFKLRKGVEFHNGKSFTADDVVASLNHHRGENSTSGGSALLSTVTDIRAEDAHTVRIDLETGNADLPFIMTDYHFVMFPSDGEGSIDWSGVGLGGYVLEEFEPGIVAIGSRNPNYFKEGKANFDAVEISQVTDVVAREAGVQTGQFDAMIEADPKTANLLAQNEDVIVEEIATGQHASMPMHTDVAPFDDVNVRLALKYALDREGALDVVLHGHGTVGNDHPISPTLPYHDPGIEQRVYDPDKAKWHLKQAGMDSLAVDFSTSEVPFVGGVNFSVFYQETAKAAGIDVNVIREAEDGYWSNVWLVKPFVVCVDPVPPLNPLRPVRLGPAPDSRHDLLTGLLRSRAVERRALAERAFRRAVDPGSCRTRRQSPRGDVLGDAAARARRRRHDRAVLPQLHLGYRDQRAAHRERVGRVVPRRQPRTGTLVVR